MNIDLTDEWIYRLKYTVIGSDSFFNIINRSEFGFSILNWLLYRVSNNSQLLIFFCACITNILLINSIKKYSNIFWISIYIYICLGLFTTSFNIMRQFLAISIIYGGMKYLINKDFKKYLLIVLLASTIHNSSLIMIPIYFIVNRGIITKSIFKILIVSFIALILFDKVAIYLNSILENTGTRGAAYLSTIVNNEGYGVNPIRVLVYLCPLILGFYNLDNICKKNKNAILFLNLYIIDVMIMIVSLKFVYVARFAQFFDMALVILIPDILTSFNEDKSNKLITSIALFLYFIYFVYQISLGTSYSSIFASFI